MDAPFMIGREKLQAMCRERLVEEPRSSQREPDLRGIFLPTLERNTS
jgi:hypothetical protein